MRKRSGISHPRAHQAIQRRATGLLACFALSVFVVSTALPNAGAQTIPANLETCGYLNVVLTASGAVASDAAKSLKSAAGDDLDPAEVASLDKVIESGTTIDDDGAAKLKARNESSCKDLDVCPLIASIGSDDPSVMSKAALVLRDLSQPVPPSVALAFRDLIDADDAEAPFTAQRDRVREYFADKNCSGGAAANGDAGSGTGGNGGSGTGGSSGGDAGSGTSGSSGGNAGSTPVAPTPTPKTNSANSAAASEVANKAEQALSGSSTATPVPATKTTAPTAATPTAAGAQALPNTGLGTEALYFSFAAAALVAVGAWLLALPGIRR